MPSPSKKLEPSNKAYSTFLAEIKQQIQATRIQVTRIANREVLSLYWWFGEKIVSAQAQYGWGKSIVEKLAKDLKKAFPYSTYGFSPRNLWDMRRFYLEYKDQPNLRRFVAEIPWGQHLAILNKIKDNKAREYYLEAVQQMGWTRNTLTLQIQSHAYERHHMAKKQHNFTKTLPEHLAEQATQTLKAVYMLDALGLRQPVVESQIENRMIHKIKDVMLELGYGFTYIGNQYRIVAPSGTESFIDLLFFNRKLRSLVAMELKVGKFKPEYAGKMNYYLNLLDDEVRGEGENPSIGIILCSDHNRIDVEYALRGIDKPVGVANFLLTKELPPELHHLLPDPKEIEMEILREMGVEQAEEVASEKKVASNVPPAALDKPKKKLKRSK